MPSRSHTGLASKSTIAASSNAGIETNRLLMLPTLDRTPRGPFPCALAGRGSVKMDA